MAASSASSRATSAASRIGSDGVGRGAGAAAPSAGRPRVRGGSDALPTFAPAVRKRTCFAMPMRPNTHETDPDFGEV